MRSPASSKGTSWNAGFPFTGLTTGSSWQMCPYRLKWALAGPPFLVSKCPEVVYGRFLERNGPTWHRRAYA